MPDGTPLEPETITLKYGGTLSCDIIPKGSFTTKHFAVDGVETDTYTAVGDADVIWYLKILYYTLTLKAIIVEDGEFAEVGGCDFTGGGEYAALSAIDVGTLGCAPPSGYMFTGFWCDIKDGNAGIYMPGPLEGDITLYAWLVRS